MISIFKLNISMIISSSSVKIGFIDAEFIVNVACVVKSLNDAPVLRVKGSCNRLSGSITRVRNQANLPCLLSNVDPPVH